MNLVLALTIAIVFASGAYLLLRRDLIQVAAGTMLISNAVILFVVATGLARGRAPIYPLPEEQTVSDPVVQALALTAIVIGFGATAVLLALIYRLFMAHRSVDQRDVAQVEEAAVERDEGAE